MSRFHGKLTLKCSIFRDSDLCKQGLEGFVHDDDDEEDEDEHENSSDVEEKEEVELDEEQAMMKALGLPVTFGGQKKKKSPEVSPRYKKQGFCHIKSCSLKDSRPRDWLLASIPAK